MINKIIPMAVVMSLVLAPAGRPSLQQDPPLPECCLHIFMAGFSLGMAYVITEEGVFYEDLATFLSNASRFVRAANAACSRINPAWPDWQQKQNDIQQWTDRLRRNADSQEFPKANAYLQNSRQSYGERLMVQIVASRYVRMDTCEEKYFKLGFDLANARGCLIIASGGSLSSEARMDYIVEAQQAVDRARNVLDQLSQVEPVTGSCAPLGDLKALMARWQVTYDSRQVTKANDALINNVYQEAQRILGDCKSSLGGAAGAGGPTLASVIGRWTLTGQKYNAASRQWEYASYTDHIEFYGTQVQGGYEASEGSIWKLEGGKLWVWDPQEIRGSFCFYYQADGTWIGYALNPDGTFMTKEARLVLTRE